jgi:hypothetical protein
MRPRGMRRLEDVLGAGIAEQVFLASGIPTPEAEADVSRLLVDEFDRSVGELFPTHMSMGLGDAVLDGQDAVQEENTLLGPGNEIAVRCPRPPGRSEDLAVDVAKARRTLNFLGNRER